MLNYVSTLIITLGINLCSYDIQHADIWLTCQYRRWIFLHIRLTLLIIFLNVIVLPGPHHGQ